MWLANLHKPSFKPDYQFKTTKIMDLGSAIIGAILFLGCIAPFVIMYYKRQNKENNKLQMLRDLAQQHNCALHHHEFCGDFVIGMDDEKKWVFFSKQGRDGHSMQWVDLANTQSCQVSKKHSGLKSDIGKFGFTERVALDFLPLNGSKEASKFELYAKEINMQLSGELQLADRWSNRINERLKK